MPRLLLIVALFTLSVTLSIPASAKSLFVNAQAQPQGDGTAGTPFRRITDAVEEARKIRPASAEKIVIHVAPGTYRGTFSATRLAANPDLETLPIILNVGRLTVLGSTELQDDDRGLPTGTNGQRDTIVTADRTLVLGESLLLIAPTVDHPSADGVTVAGFILDAGVPAASSAAGRAIIAERISDFAIRRNVVRHTYT